MLPLTSPEPFMPSPDCQNELFLATEIIFLKTILIGDPDSSEKLIY